MSALLVVKEFRGDYHFLSNFWPWDGPRVRGPLAWVDFEGVRYPSSEHAYQAAKAGAGAIEVKRRIAGLLTFDIRGRNPAHQAKREGARSWGYTQEGWDLVKDSIMHRIVRAKFEQNPEIRRWLLATRGARLEEGNGWRDRYWGVSPVGSGRGCNKLGIILMHVRRELGVKVPATLDSAT